MLDRTTINFDRGYTVAQKQCGEEDKILMLLLLHLFIFNSVHQVYYNSLFIPTNLSEICCNFGNFCHNIEKFVAYTQVPTLNYILLCDYVVCVCERERGPVSKKSMELNDSLFFLQTELASFNIRSQIINPPQSAALPTSLQP